VPQQEEQEILRSTDHEVPAVVLHKSLEHEIYFLSRFGHVFWSRVLVTRFGHVILCYLFFIFF